MTAIGGSPQECSLAGRKFSCVADSEVSIIIGGYQNEVQPNGNGSVRLVKTVVAPAVNGLQVECDFDRNDLEYLQQLADRKALFPFSVTLVTGVTYSGQMQIVESAPEGNSGNATVELTLAGEQKLKKQNA